MVLNQQKQKNKRGGGDKVISIQNPPISFVCRTQPAFLLHFNLVGNVIGEGHYFVHRAQLMNDEVNNCGDI